MEYSQIQAVNEEIKPVDIKGKEYAEVAQRVMAFRKIEPNGKILTEMLFNENGTCIFKATIIDGNEKILAVGHACEREGVGNINKLSHIENCETSAVGRALGFCGIGSAGSIASAEEVQNATETLDKNLLKEAAELKIELEKVAVYLKKKVEDLTNDDLKSCIDRKKAQKKGSDK